MGVSKGCVVALLVLLGTTTAALGVDLAPFASVDYTRAKFTPGVKTYDVLVSGGLRIKFESLFELEMGLSVPNPLIKNDYGVRFAGGLYGGLNLFGSAPISPYFAVGVSGLFGELGCEYVYAGGPSGMPGDYRCLTRNQTTGGAGYRAGFKLNGRNDRKATLYFSQLYGESGINVFQISIGVEF